MSCDKHIKTHFGCDMNPPHLHCVIIATRCGKLGGWCALATHSANAGIAASLQLANSCKVQLNNRQDIRRSTMKEIQADRVDLLKFG